VEPPLWAPRRVNEPSKHSDGRLSIRELLLFVVVCVWVRGLGLTAFCGLDDMNVYHDMNVYRGYTKPNSRTRRRVVAVIASWAGLETI
jgi:hypothetical protein